MGVRSLGPLYVCMHKRVKQKVVHYFLFVKIWHQRVQLVPESSLNIQERLCIVFESFYCFCMELGIHKCYCSNLIISLILGYAVSLFKMIILCFNKLMLLCSGP